VCVCVCETILTPQLSLNISLSHTIYWKYCPLRIALEQGRSK
jgi:hypothetical protein